MHVEKTIKFIILMFTLGFSIFNPANAEDLTTTHISSIKLNNVTYDQAEINIIFYYADDEKNTSLALHIPEVSRIYSSNHLKSGFNDIRVNISRDKKRHKKVSSSKVKVTIYDNSNKTNKNVWENEVDLTIDWPGPEYIQNIISGQNIKKNDFSTIRLISINKLVDPEGDIYKNILLNGAPIHKVRRLGSKGTGFTHAEIIIGNQVSIDIAKLLISETKNKIKHISKISIANNKLSRHGENDIYVTAGNMKNEMSKQLVHEIVSSKTDDEFYKLIGHKVISKKESIDEKYKLAYSLIDQGGRNNLYRAKSLLDEIIALDPNYARAYLELARFHMKTSKDFNNEGLKKAERSILIAKRIDPKLSDTRTLLGYVYTNQKKFKKAQKEYEEADRLGSDNSWLEANWGLNYQMQGDTKNAIAKYSILLNKKRKFDRNDRPMIWIKDYLFPLFIKSQRYKEADLSYTRYVTNFPEKHCMYLDQADLRLFNLNNYQGAIESHLKATKMGCKKQSMSLAISYYAKWNQKTRKKSSKEANLAFNQAEGLALSDVDLFQGLSKSSYLAKLIKPLLKTNRSIDTEDSEGFNALLYLIYKKDILAFNHLLSNGANVNYESKKLKVTPIMLAVMTKDINVVKSILKRKPDLSKTLPNGQSLSEWANSNNLIEIAGIVTLNQKT